MVMQGSPPPQQILTQPTNVEAQYGDGSEVWGQTPNQAQYQVPNQAQYQVPNQAHYQIPIQPAMGMGYYPTTNATVALVLSILGFVGCSIFTAIPGLIMANTALQTTNAMPGHPDSGIAKAAQIVAWICIGLFILALFFYGVMFAILIASGDF
tara:strand:+ start:158 stop:616 length:459 start_codon:yes stop_codon:yes gene_type:complete